MPIFLSASSIVDYIKCPKKFYYRVNKPFPPVPSRDMILGTSIHYILEKGWKHRDLANQILSEESDKLKCTQKERTNLSFMVDMFFLNFRHLIGDSDLIEYNFKLQLHSDVFLVGKIDRISQGNVFDWKSGRVAKNLEGDVQSIVYDYAFNKLFGRPPVSLCVASLSQGQLIPYSKNEQFARELFDEIMPSMVKAIKSNDLPKLGIFNHGCFRCQYKLGCIGVANVVDSPDPSE